MSEFTEDRLLIVGLGNPGSKYEGTRHNIGFDIVRELAMIGGITLANSNFEGLAGAGTLWGRQVVLLLPQTYMNLSGQSVGKAARFYRIPVQNLIVAHDEIEIAAGTVRLKRGGGHAGHNGLKSIDQHMSSKDYVRIRLGVGRPFEQGDVSNWVLSKFGKADQAALENLIRRGPDAVEFLIKSGLVEAQNLIHPLK